jgi:hypothetical protein
MSFFIDYNHNYKKLALIGTCGIAMVFGKSRDTQGYLNYSRKIKIKKVSRLRARKEKSQQAFITRATLASSIPYYRYPPLHPGFGFHTILRAQLTRGDWTIQIAIRS